MDDHPQQGELDVKMLIPAAIAVMFLMGAQPNLAVAQNAAGIKATTYRIAVVDIPYIFTKHARFIASGENIKKQIQQIQAKLKAEEQVIVEAQQKMVSMYKPGTPDFKREDEALAAKKAEFSLALKKHQTDIRDLEAANYYSTYVDVNRAISNYAKQKGIGLVLRFSGDPADPTNHESIMRALNAEVQYQDSIDITGDILRLVNQGQASTASRQAPSGQQRPVQR